MLDIMRTILFLEKNDIKNSDFLKKKLRKKNIFPNEIIFS